MKTFFLVPFLGLLIGPMFFAKGGLSMEITSSAFEQGNAIPQKYSCDGRDISPPLSWSGIPGGTKSLALILEDPDAPMGLFIHWVLANLAPDTSGLSENTTSGDLPQGTVQGKNSWDKQGYGGPCPPDKKHRYFFRLYALDTMLELSGAPEREELLSAMEGHILEQAELMGTYER